MLSAGGDVGGGALVRSARRLVWRQLKGFCMKAGVYCLLVGISLQASECWPFIECFLRWSLIHPMSKTHRALASSPSAQRCCVTSPEHTIQHNAEKQF